MSHVWLWFKTSSLKVYFQPKFEGSKCTFRSSVKVVVINSLFVSGIQEVNCFLEIHIWDSWKICCRDHFWSLLLTGIQEINLYYSRISKISSNVARQYWSLDTRFLICESIMAYLRLLNSAVLINIEMLYCTLSFLAIICQCY